MPKETEPSFLPEKYRFLKKKAEVDLLYVDEDLQEIAVLVQDAGECVALANEIRDAAKRDLELVEAEEAARLRGIPTANGKPPSEYALPSMIPLCQTVQDAINALGEARLDASLWATVVNALMTKSSAIRTAADLITCGFLTTDYLKNNHRKAIRNVQVEQ
jgi:hypothetical protein